MAEKQKVSLNVDSKNWTKLRIRAIEEGKTATEIIESMIEKFLKDKR